MDHPVEDRGGIYSGLYCLGYHFQVGAGSVNTLNANQEYRANEK